MCVSPALTALARLGAKGTFGETLPRSPPGRHPALGPLAAASPIQPLPLSSSCREGDSQASLPLAQGTPFPISSSSHHPLHSHLHEPVPFDVHSMRGLPHCWRTRAALLPSCMLRRLPWHVLWHLQRVPFLLCQPKVCITLPQGLAIITSHKWWGHVTGVMLCPAPEPLSHKLPHLPAAEVLEVPRGRQTPMLTVLPGPLVRLSSASFPVAPWPLLSPRGSVVGATASPLGELLASTGAFSVLGKGHKGGPGEQRMEKRETLSGAGCPESLPGLT